jgi:hypothetical protein
MIWHFDAGLSGYDDGAQGYDAFIAIPGWKVHQRGAARKRADDIRSDEACGRGAG